MSHTITFTELGPADFRPSIGLFVSVYAAAMNPPKGMLSGRETIMERHAAHPGFRALTAVAEPDGSGPGASEIAGFVYGFHGAKGQWWHDMVASALAFHGAGAGWLADSVEIAELHVVPAYQGAGIGRSLLRRLLSPRPEKTALLSTPDTESPARRLYRGVGFTDLLTGYRFAGGDPPFAIMGARLPLLPETQLPGTQRPEVQRPDAAASPSSSSPNARSPRPSSS